MNTNNTQYDDATLQDAIDAAFQIPELNGEGALYTYQGSSGQGWSREAKLRLSLARALLARLLEPTPPTADGKTPGQVCWEKWAVIPPVISHEWSLIQNKDAWEHAASAVLAAFGQASLEAGIKRMEAIGTGTLAGCFDSSHLFSLAALEKVKSHLIAAAREGQPAAVDCSKCEWNKKQVQLMHLALNQAKAEFINLASRAEKAEARIHPDDHDRIVKGIQDRAKSAIAEARQEALPQLRPISEAGPVPEGCVRVYSYEKSKDRWVHWKELEHTTTHFADIRLPSQAPVVEPPQPWQPSVGDVVRLRSGGPEMTVLDPEENGEFWCAWFAEETLLSQDFPAACLTPAKEEQP